MSATPRSSLAVFVALSLVVVPMLPAQEGGIPKPESGSSPPPPPPAPVSTPAPGGAGSPGPGAISSVPPDPAALRNHILSLARELDRPGTNHKKLIQLLARRFFQLGKNADPSLNPARVALVAAAEKARMWRTMLATIELFAHSDPHFGRPIPGHHPSLAWGIRALIGIGNYKQAAVILERFSKMFPQDPEVDLWRSEYEKHFDEFAKCEEAARVAVQKNDKTGRPLSPELLALAHYNIYSALLYQGKLDPAEAELKIALGLNSGDTRLRHAETVLAAARLHKFVYSRVIQESIPLGIYHLYSSKPDGRGPAGSVCSFRLRTLTPGPRSVAIDVSIPGYTDNQSRTIILLPGKTTRTFLSPPLKTDFVLTNQRAEVFAQLVVKMRDSQTGESLVDYSYPVKLLPYDMLPMSIWTDEETQKPRDDLMAAWITPNAKAIEEFLSTSKKRAPAGKFVGTYGASLPQVKAMFYELRASGVSYVLDPTISAEVGHVQRTRLPSEVLASHNAQCVEGSLLFASLLESIGLSPFVVRVPGHAFVGWTPTAADHAPAGSAYYLETTMVGSRAPFEAAMQAATERMAKEDAAGNFKNGRAVVVQVQKMREAGITPQPYENTEAGNQRVSIPPPPAPDATEREGSQ